MSEWAGYPHLQEVVMQRSLFLRVACVLALTVGGGAAVGALIGASVKRWKTVYRAP